MSLAGPRSKSAVPSKKSKKGPLSTAAAEKSPVTESTEKKPQSGKAKVKGKGRECESSSEAEAEAAPSASASNEKGPAKKKGILKNGNKKVLATSTPAEEANDEHENEKQQAEEQEILLHGFSSESDSSDEDDEDMDEAPLDVGKLPIVAKDDVSVKRRLEKAKKQASAERGVIYLGRIPHGFYEDEMKAYFTQFGDVSRIRLSRNKKTGRSKHYAFIEFESAAVAQIVAETMDNYLMLGHILRCKVISKDEVHPQLWIGANRKFRRVPTARIVRQQQNRSRTEEEQQRVEERLLKRQAEKKRKILAAGIDYDMDSIGYTKRTKQTA